VVFERALYLTATALSSNISDNAGLIEMLTQHLDYFQSKFVNIPKITILLDHGYHERASDPIVGEGVSADHAED
jgi:hypothetical protein